MESTEILSGDGLTHSMLTFNADFTYYVEYEEYEQGEEFIESESGRYTNTDKTITLFINGGDEGRAAEYEIVSGQLHIVLFDKETGQDDEGKPIREIEIGVYERQ